MMYTLVMDEKEATKVIKKIVWQHLDPRSYQVFLFGSRANGRSRQWSDFDIGIMGEKPLPIIVQADVEDALETSPIPYLVEIVDFHKVDAQFKKLALEDAISWN